MLAVVEAGALAGVARRAGGLDQREDRVLVAVERSACSRRTLPEVSPLCHSSWRERDQNHISPVSRVRRERLVVHVREREHLAGAGVLDYAGQRSTVDYRYDALSGS